MWGEDLSHGVGAGVRPTPDTHPGIQFWNKADYTRWKETPAASAGVRGKLPYLEDTNGNPIDDATEIQKPALPEKRPGARNKACDEQHHQDSPSTSERDVDVGPHYPEAGPSTNIPTLSPEPDDAAMQCEIGDRSLATNTDDAATQPDATQSPADDAATSMTGSDDRPSTTIIATCQDNTATSERKVTDGNPLSALSLAQAGMVIPPLPPTPDKEAINPKQKVMVTKMPRGGKGGKAQPDTKTKMRPGTAQNGCNLCIYHWWKQVKKGNAWDFEEYYMRTLTPEQRAGYDKEATELAANYYVRRWLGMYYG
ncbi:hypothetical protein PAXINDRAFT_157644 [Paxillus involutus ATCC 200175]|uniref:Uncharacterized protein n=1 Tax=Paxillus involutus ATCC 200175 TaxID=664439 RepID=A0A0C9TT35_PAXIN|nr:hypothetical protein PAXINDRAFT_157644 [Paxillus involutus ATCC 200175]